MMSVLIGCPECSLYPLPSYPIFSISHPSCYPPTPTWHTALALAMARDGSSGGCIRMCVITEDKVERHFVPGNELPRWVWRGVPPAATVWVC